MEGSIKRLERQRDYPANPGPDPETGKHWASLWIEAGVEEPRAKAAALEFLLYCQIMGKAPTCGYGPRGLLRRCEGNIGSGEDYDGPGEPLHEVLEQGHD